MSGWIFAIAGPMFSGKSSELLRHFRDFRKLGIRCRIFTSALDTRYGTGKVITHNGDSEDAVQVSCAADIEAGLDDSVKVVFIDEPHLIKGKVADLCRKLAREGRKVFVAGLDLDYRGNPFPEMSAILNDADTVLKTHGKCAICGGPSRYSYRKTQDGKRLLVGGANIYEPRCRDCFKD